MLFIDSWRLGVFPSELASPLFLEICLVGEPDLIVECALVLAPGAWRTHCVLSWYTGFEDSVLLASLLLAGWRALVSADL